MSYEEDVTEIDGDFVDIIHFHFPILSSFHLFFSSFGDNENGTRYTFTDVVLLKGDSASFEKTKRASHVPHKFAILINKGFLEFRISGISGKLKLTRFIQIGTSDE